MNQSIASVTVAYNGAKMLPRQMDALLTQARALQEIVVVDNASTDGTSAMLAGRYPQVTVLRMKENVGAAGAWARGLSYAALERRHDWIWSFDDDSVPNAFVLANLLDGIGSLNGTRVEVGMVAPMPVHQKTGTRYPPLLWRNGFVKPSISYMQNPLWFADLIIASGCLVRSELVRKIGLPRADFFMDFFDYEYSLRARLNGYKIAVISHAELDHEIGNARTVWAGRLRLWSCYAPWREYYNSRNMVYAGWHLYPNLGTKCFVLGHLARHAGAVLLFSPEKTACLTKMAQGIWDGCRAKLGIRFTPNGHPSDRKNGVPQKSDSVQSEDRQA